MTKLHVAHVITGLGAGGAEQMLSRVTTASVKRGTFKHSVFSLMDEGHFGAGLVEAGVAVTCIGMRSGQVSPRHLIKLVNGLQNSRPSVVMTWLYHADLLGLLAARTAGRLPVVWNIRCSDMDLSRYGLGTRIVVSALKRLSHWPEAVAYNSVAGREFHEKLGYRPQLWLDLPNGYDLSEWKPNPHDRSSVREALGVDGNTCVIAHVARADPQKDHGTLFDALERLASAVPIHVMLIGSGTDMLRLPRSIRTKITRFGRTNEVSKLLRGADIAVSSSAYGEGLPNSLAEAMATAIPCIGTDVGDTARLIGQTGRVVAPKNPIGLANAILDIVKMAPEERTALGQLARYRVKQCFSIEACVNKYEDAWSGAASHFKD